MCRLKRRTQHASSSKLPTCKTPDTFSREHSLYRFILQSSIHLPNHLHSLVQLLWTILTIHGTRSFFLQQFPFLIWRIIHHILFSRFLLFSMLSSSESFSHFPSDSLSAISLFQMEHNRLHSFQHHTFPTTSFSTFPTSKATHDQPSFLHQQLTIMTVWYDGNLKGGHLGCTMATRSYRARAKKRKKRKIWDMKIRDYEPPP